MINDNPDQLALSIKEWGKQLGFSDVRITDIDLAAQQPGLDAWLAASYHGDMDYMAKHGDLRSRPDQLVAQARRVIMVRMDYLPQQASAGWVDNEIAQLGQPEQAVISVYARGRDYHKVLRTRLQQLADRIDEAIGPFGYRAFVDSAPVMEVALAEKSGLGWRGKHTLLLNRDAGSTFFIGEIITNLELPVDAPTSNHCGSCTACIDCCPTQAILAPQRLDARRCISYLTIEHKGSIPDTLRPLIGNRVYGCDDCQLYCPWNKFAQRSTVPDFAVRNGLDNITLIELFSWEEQDFLEKTAGSPIRRIGHERWLRNLAVGLGNARRALQQSNRSTDAIDAALRPRLLHPSEMVREHVQWALAQ